MRMTTNKGFFELYEQTRHNHSKLHHWQIDGLKVWSVEGPGRRQDIDIPTCRDFGVFTTEGCVVVTHDHGVWVKVNSEQWFNPVANQGFLMHDLDILKLLVTEADGGGVATIFNPAILSV